MAYNDNGQGRGMMGPSRSRGGPGYTPAQAASRAQDEAERLASERGQEAVMEYERGPRYPGISTRIPRSKDLARKRRAFTGERPSRVHQGRFSTFQQPRRFEE